MSTRRSIFGASAADAWGSRTRKRAETDLDITPMIDVTFLLLIFFMVTSTMQQQDIDVPSARHGVGIEGGGAIVVEIKPGGSDLILAVDEKDNLSVEQVLAEVKEKAAAGKREVIIRADGRLSHGAVAQVTKAVAGIEGVEFSYGVRDQKSY